MRRRTLIQWLAIAAGNSVFTRGGAGRTASHKSRAKDAAWRSDVTVFLGGDVMTGRGVDQVLPHPSRPTLHEPALTSARDYLALAEQANGPIPRPAGFDYIWGDALAELERVAPAARIINLETAVTRSTAWERKGINYRMSPANVPCLAAAGIDCCVLSNNHVLDWGRAGLKETLATLASAGIATAGAGDNAAQASYPARLPLPGGGGLLVFAYGDRSSGIPSDWAATARAPGVNLLPDLSDRTVAQVAERVQAMRRSGDLVIVSLHWGANFGYAVPAAQRHFAHALIEEAGADVVHGHSSHHPKGIEVHRGRLILYGCGDLINDYEGIGGQERYHGDLVLVYFVRFARASGELAGLEMTPMRLRRFRLQRAEAGETRWLHEMLARESGRFGVEISVDGEQRLHAHWADAPAHTSS